MNELVASNSDVCESEALVEKLSLVDNRLVAMFVALALRKDVRSALKLPRK